MDKEFQTTFIPKKPLAEQKVKNKQVVKRPLGIFAMVATIIFVATIAIGVGLYFYEGFIEQQIKVSQDSLERAEKAFEPSLIVELQKLNTRLEVADGLLSRHIAVSPIFRILENTTLKSVQYNTFDYGLEPNASGRIALTGLARRYQTIAEQSLLFGDNRFITDHIFSDFTLNNEGRVSFNLNLTISPELLYFARSLGEIPTDTPTETTDVMELTTTGNEFDDGAGTPLDSLPTVPNINTNTQQGS